MRSNLAPLTCALVSASLACGSSLATGPDGSTDGTILVEAGEVDTGSDGRATRDGPGETSPPADAMKKMRDGGEPADGSPDAADAAEEPIDCLPQAPDGTTGLYVVVGGSKSSACGTLSEPCESIGLALSVATSTITTIYVGPGTFVQPGTVALADGIGIVGGWDVIGKKWTHSCVPPKITGPSPVFSASNLTESTLLDTLDLVETEAAAAGGSVYGVTALDSNLTLANVSISVMPGGAGTSATLVGDAGPNGASNGCGTPGSGAPGGDGDAGAPTGPGFFEPPPTGFQSQTNGGVGVTGGAGSNGTQGGKGAKETANVGCSAFPACNGTTETFHGGTGLGGCAGGGGLGGLPGSGGGCSIGVYAWGGSVTILGGSIRIGAGGHGGDGTTGGVGGDGEKGAEGTTNSMESCVPGVGVCKDVRITATGGKAGGPGGSGGQGGPGGGGAGGCSFGYFVGGDAGVSSDAAVKPGAGGVGGTPNGTTGPSGVHN